MDEECSYNTTSLFSFQKYTDRYCIVGTCSVRRMRPYITHTVGSSAPQYLRPTFDLAAAGCAAEGDFECTGLDAIERLWAYHLKGTDRVYDLW